MSEEVLYEIQRSLGRIEQKIDNAAQNLIAHAGHDDNIQRALFERVEALQKSHERQRGFLAALGMIGTMTGAAVGYAVDALTRHH
jgi:hypothetical protein